jgi:hypothetical protein
MSDDLPNSEVVDQFHNDLLVERLTDSDSTGFSNDLEKERAGTRYREPPQSSTGSLGGVTFRKPQRGANCDGLLVVKE